MELSKQVVSLELSRRLKELGVKQVSIFYWAGDEKLIYGEQEPPKSLKLPMISAFTIAELGEMFGGKNFAVGIDSNKYWCEWYATHGPMVQEDTENLANAAAKMLIYLLENKLI